MKMMNSFLIVDFKLGNVIAWVEKYNHSIWVYELDVSI